jgi:Family of unknown function (DUF5335)
MPTEEIPREQWPQFLESFSRIHEGWLSTVEVLDDQIGSQVEARNVPLQGIAADWKGTGGNSISIMLGGAGQSILTHTVGDLTHVRIKRTETGADEALSLESASGGRTLLRFRSPMPPDTVDGVVT